MHSPAFSPEDCTSGIVKWQRRRFYDELRRGGSNILARRLVSQQPLPPEAAVQFELLIELPVAQTRTL